MTLGGDSQKYRRCRAVKPVLLVGWLRARCPYRKSNPSVLMVQATQDRTADNVSDCLGGPYFKRPPWWTSLPILLVYGLRHTQLASTALAISLIRSSRAALIPSMRDPFTTPLSMGASSPIDKVHCHSSMPPRGLTEIFKSKGSYSDGILRICPSETDQPQFIRRAQLAPFIRSCFIGRISYLAPISSRIIGSAAVRRSTSIWFFAEKIDRPHPPLGSSTGP